jgi:ethanolamine utilization protein EutN
MLFGRVKGTAVCTSKYPGTEGLKLDDLCMMVRSREASLALPEIKFVPVDLALVGIVDQLDVRPDGDFNFTLKPGWVQYT